MVSHIFSFSPLLGEDSYFDEHIFQMGWFNHQLGGFYLRPFQGREVCDLNLRLHMNVNQWFTGGLNKQVGLIS